MQAGTAIGVDEGYTGLLCDVMKQYGAIGKHINERTQ